MTISPDLFAAILAMDSYNRGYGAGMTSDSALTSIDPSATVSAKNCSMFGARNMKLDASGFGFGAAA